jgi:pantothenate kinase
MSAENGVPSIPLSITESSFKNFSNAKRIAMDIGGSLTKIAYCSSFECKTAKFFEVAFISNLQKWIKINRIIKYTIHNTIYMILIRF